MGTKLFVAGLPFRVTSDELGELFSQAGQVVSAQVITDKFSGRSRGFGFVEMATPEEAQAAIEKFHNYSMEGRSLVVNEARPMEPRTGGGGGGGRDFHRGGGGGGRGGFDRGGRGGDRGGRRRDY